MPLEEGQVQVRDLVMGPGTPYTVNGFNPFIRRVRAEQSEARAWGHGGWSGAEWQDERVAPMQILVGETGSMASWMQLDQALADAFAPVGDSGVDAECRFKLGGREYVMYGRPRMVEPQTDHVGFGWSITQAAFVALGPLIYDGIPTTFDLGLPSFAGGIAAPLAAPIWVPSVSADGEVELVHIGTAPVGLQFTITGPVSEPRVTVQGPDGTVSTLRVALDLASGQSLQVDTQARSVLLDGAGSRRGEVEGEWPVVRPGVSRLMFRAAAGSDEASVTGEFRSGWW